MNLYGDIPKETLVEKLENYEYSPDYNWRIFTGESRTICDELWGKENPEIWDLTMDAFHENAPRAKEKRVMLLKGLKRVYKKYCDGEMDIERYAGCVSAQCGGVYRKRMKNYEIQESVKEKFKGYIEDTNAFLDDKVAPFILKKKAEYLLKVAEEEIEKVKASS